MFSHSFSSPAQHSFTTWTIIQCAWPFTRNTPNRYAYQHSLLYLLVPVPCLHLVTDWRGTSLFNTKTPWTEFPIKNDKISTLDPNNFFLAWFCYTILYETYLIPIYSIYWKFAPILRSQKKVDFFMNRVYQQKCYLINFGPS